MGINNRFFELINKFCKRTESNGTVLFAGYPDFLVDTETLNKLFLNADFTIDSASEIIKSTHNTKIDQAYDPREVFKALGYTDSAIIDIAQERGVEEIIDLNYPHDLNAFDLVVDHGTIEHCFNVAQAAINLAQAVKLNGFIAQHLPATMGNHGFYNFNPTWFFDFYENNGFNILHLEGWCLTTQQLYALPKYGDYTGLPEQSLISMVAQRKELKPITYPLQHKYNNDARTSSNG